MVVTKSPKIEAPTVTTIPLENWGLFGPPLGEPIDGAMPTAGLRLWTSSDGTIRTGVWECGPGRFRTTYDDEGEFIWLVAGELTCIEAGGLTTRLGVGDAMLLPPGWSGEWRIEGTLRKVLAGWTDGAGGKGRGSGPMLAAPVLSPGEAAALALEERAPFPPERTGAGPLAKRSRTLWQSADGSLEVGVWEIDAGRFRADFGAFGECIRILSGEMRCTPDDGGEPFALRAGDWMTFPRGWTGEWVMPAPLRKVYVTWEAC
ncbi:MAG: hypothetical protein K0S78_1650 [Thermomicrobiales bacterium]|nr:hypothetical protein [Thermomicrobiales bacterium]